MDSSTTETTDDITGALCVFYSDSPFSDFAPYSFTIEGTVYASVEHYFQIQMLRSFGLFKLAMKLSTIYEANQFRRVLRQNLRSLTQNGLFDERLFDSWRTTNAMRLLKKANRAKFEQNFDLKKHLLETEDRILVFTSKHDRLFGVGMDEMALLNWIRQQKWTIDDLLDSFVMQESGVDGILGRNLLGLCLMDIRAELSGQPSILSVWKQRTRQRQAQHVGEQETVAASGDSMGEEDGCVAVENGAEISDHQGGEDSEDHLTDDHILANLSNAEASIADESESAVASCHHSAQLSSNSTVVYRIPNEKRIVIRRSDFVPRVVGGPSEDRVLDSASTPTQSHSSAGVEETVSVLDGDSATDLPATKQSDKRLAVLERVKALRFQKPMINPFAIAGNGPTVSKPLASHPATWTQRNLMVRPANLPRRRKIPRLCDLPPVQFPLYGNGYAVVHPHLEPGEVPSPNYGPEMMPAGHPMYFPPHLAEGGSESNWHESEASSSNRPSFPVGPPAAEHANDAEAGELWTPSSNPMRDVFESAKVGIKKLIDNAKQGNANSNDISRLLLLRPPPIQSQPQARKRKCTTGKKAPMYTGLFFNSKDAQMRHVSNRWIKGGRLTTTGKFEECGDEEPEAAEIAKTLRQLEAVPECVDVENESKSDTPVQFHVVYEDTNEYADYVRWYANVHGCAPSDVVDDEYQQYLRQWYRWYKSAVKFVDVEPLSGDGEDVTEDGASTSDVTGEQRSHLLMQQWRWQQINEWELKSRAQSRTPAISQETYSDGVSFSGKPMTYKAPVQDQ